MQPASNKHTRGTKHKKNKTGRNSVGRMPDLGSGCRAFESPRPDEVDVRFNSSTKTDWKLSTNHYGACSSVGRASDCGSEGPGFETLLTPISASLV